MYWWQQKGVSALVLWYHLQAGSHLVFFSDFWSCLAVWKKKYIILVKRAFSLLSQIKKAFLIFFHQQLKKTVDDLQAKLSLAKGEYKTALKNLEMISDEIHERRRASSMGPRGCGVGAEGSNTTAENLSVCKLESDNISSKSKECVWWALTCERTFWSCRFCILQTRCNPNKCRLA